MNRPENTGGKQVGRFEKGTSGNPSGRPRGSRNAATLACEALLDGQAEALTQKAIHMALAGDPVALRLCLDRLCPPRKDRPVTFPMRPINSARDAAEALSDLASAVLWGRITPSDAEVSPRSWGHGAKAFEIAELVDRARQVRQMPDAELYRIAAGERADKNGEPRLLTMCPR